MYNYLNRITIELLQNGTVGNAVTASEPTYPTEGPLPRAVALTYAVQKAVMRHCADNDIDPMTVLFGACLLLCDSISDHKQHRILQAIAERYPEMNQGLETKVRPLVTITA